MMNKKQFQEEILQHYKLTSGDKKKSQIDNFTPKGTRKKRTNEIQSQLKEGNYKGQSENK